MKVVILKDVDLRGVQYAPGREVDVTAGYAKQLIDNGIARAADGVTVPEVEEKPKDAAKFKVGADLPVGTRQQSVAFDPSLEPGAKPPARRTTEAPEKVERSKEIVSAEDGLKTPKRRSEK